MRLAQAIDRRIRALGLAKQIQLGVINSITEMQQGALPRVMISGIADQAISCDWSGAFAAEMALAKDPIDLVGRQVEVHFVDDQPIVAYTVIVGDK